MVREKCFKRNKRFIDIDNKSGYQKNAFSLKLNSKRELKTNTYAIREEKSFVFWFRWEDQITEKLKN